MGGGKRFLLRRNPCDIFLLRVCALQAGVAQLVEQLICNQQVAGSSPIAGFL